MHACSSWQREDIIDYIKWGSTILSGCSNRLVVVTRGQMRRRDDTMDVVLISSQMASDFLKTMNVVMRKGQ